MTLPIIKITGGKRQLLGQMRPFWPHVDQYEDYHEPFFGGGAVFFDLAPSLDVTLSDSNERLIRMYRGIKTHCASVIEVLLQIEKGYGHWKTVPSADSPARVQAAYLKYLKETFTRYRELDVDLMSDEQVAVWFLLMNRLGYNGMYRVNSKNKFNVPFGKFPRTIPRILFQDELLLVSEALQRAKLVHSDFRASFAKVTPKAFVFCDAPYAPLSKTSDFTAYTQEGFSIQDQIDLVQESVRLVEQKGAWLRLTNSHAAWLRGEYENHGFRAFALSARRSVNSDVTKRGEVIEYLYVPASQITEAMGEPLPLLMGDERLVAYAERARILDLYRKNEARKEKRKNSPPKKR